MDDQEKRINPAAQGLDAEQVAAAVVQGDKPVKEVVQATEELDPRYFYEPGSSNSGKLAHVKTDDDHIKRDPAALTQTASVEKDFSVTWPLYDPQTKEALDISDLTEARIVLDIIAAKCQETGSPEVSLGVAEYLEKRGLSKTNRTKTREKLETIRRIWHNATLHYKRYVKTPGADKAELRDFDCHVLRESTPLEKWKRGDLIVVLDPRYISDILHIETGKAPMLFLTGLVQIDTKYHPDAYYIGRKIVEQKNNSKGNANEDRLAVKTLLNEVRSRKSFNELLKDGNKNRVNIRAKVREPFEADLNHFCEKTGLDYKFHYPNNGPLVPDDVLETCSFTDYCNFVLWFEWPTLPARFVEYKQKKIEGREHAQELQKIEDEADRQILIDDAKKRKRAAKTKAKKKAEAAGA